MLKNTEAPFCDGDLSTLSTLKYNTAPFQEENSAILLRGLKNTEAPFSYVDFRTLKKKTALQQKAEPKTFINQLRDDTRFEQKVATKS